MTGAVDFSWFFWDMFFFADSGFSLDMTLRTSALFGDRQSGSAIRFGLRSIVPSVFFFVLSKTSKRT